MEQIPWDKVFIEDEAKIESEGKEIPPKTVLIAYNSYLKTGNDSEISKHGAQLKDGERLVTLFLELCETYFNERPAGRLLDVGCGAGHLTEAFRQKGFEVLGIDILKSAVSIAASKYPDCEFKVFNARYSDNFGGKCFDVIHMREFYPFTRSGDFEKQKDLILDYCKILKNNGYMVIIGSNWCIDRHMNYHKMVNYLNEYHNSELQAIGPFYESLHRYFSWIRRSKFCINVSQPLWQVICRVLKRYPWNYLIIRKHNKK
ncbi:MAG: methyltransferase domain-containing protein [Sedimentisphaerales bacterium]|jgi:SAM-dependent methyltransferase